MSDLVQICPGLRGGYTGLQSADQVQKMASTQVHQKMQPRGWQPNLCLAYQWKVGRQHSNDGQALSIQTYVAANNLRITTEVPLPDPIAENRDLGRSHLLVVFLEVAPEQQRDAQSSKEARRN